LSTASPGEAKETTKSAEIPIGNHREQIKPPTTELASK